MTESLIDPQTGPYSPPADIAAEIEVIRRLPASAARDYMLELMQRWIDERWDAPRPEDQ